MGLIRRTVEWSSTLPSDQSRRFGAELLPALLAHWEARAFLQDALETEARERLAGKLVPEELEILIEQHLATDQTEFLAEFLWVLDTIGCRRSDRMASWIDRHNALVARMRAQLAPEARRNHPLGPQHKRKLWRLGKAHFSPKVKAACCARLDGKTLVLALRDLERFMALHMDSTLCRDRLDALVQIGLLEDELLPNLRLFRMTEQLRAIVTRAETLRAGLGSEGDGDDAAI
jgi:hypothetical protein